LTEISQKVIVRKIRLNEKTYFFEITFFDQKSQLTRVSTSNGLPVMITGNTVSITVTVTVFFEQ
jgi:hypothetical protein